MTFALQDIAALLRASPASMHREISRSAQQAVPHCHADRQTCPVLQHSRSDIPATSTYPRSIETDAHHAPQPHRLRLHGERMRHALADVQLQALAEDAWLLRFGDAIDVDINTLVLAASAQLQAHLPDIECVPAYASLLLRFDPAQWLDEAAPIAGQRLRETIESVLQYATDDAVAMREIELPVWYAGADLHDVATHARMSAEEVIARHSAASYRVAMLGFAPGFPYLLGLDPALAMPRRSNPRTHVPAGSVAIGGLQTGIYPQALPGGWQLIGRTPVRLFDLAAASPSLLHAGDRVRFRAIGEDDYQRLAADAGASS